MSPYEPTTFVHADFNELVFTNNKVKSYCDCGFRCDLCGQCEFKTRAELVDHGLREHRLREIKCSLCAFKSSSLQLLRNHIKAGHHLSQDEVTCSEGGTRNTVKVRSPHHRCATNSNQDDNHIDQQVVKAAAKVNSVSQNEVRDSTACLAKYSQPGDHNQSETPKQFQRNYSITLASISEQNRLKHSHTDKTVASKSASQNKSLEGADSDWPMSSLELNSLEEFTEKHHTIFTRRPDGFFNCPQCSYVTKKKPHLEQHLMTHSDEKPFACRICDYRSRWPGNVRRHAKKNHQADQEQSFRTKDDIHGGAAKATIPVSATKSQKKLSKPTTANFPTTAYTTVTVALEVLKQQDMPNTGDKLRQKLDPSLPIDDQNKSLQESAPEELTKDDKKTERGCSGVYRKHASLKSSSVLEITNRSYHYCSKCNYRTKSKSNLKTHLWVHSKKKPFECENCDFRTKWVSNLRMHERKWCRNPDHQQQQRNRPNESKESKVTVMTHPTYQTTLKHCSIGEVTVCNSLAISNEMAKAGLQVVKKLSGQEEVTCILRRYGLKDKKWHAKEMTRCPICGIRSLGRFLHRHVLLHTNIKPFACVAVEGCCYRSHWPSDVLKHAKRVHQLEGMEN